MNDRTIEFIRTYFHSSEFIPLHAPFFHGNEKNYLIDCIDSTYVSSVGKYVDRFEEMVASYTNAQKAVVCVNGTNALQLALILAGVQQGDEVITQPLTFIATANAISYIGAKPVFIDVDINTMGLSPVAVSDWLDNHATMKNGQCINRITGRKIKACVPMHTFGHPVRLYELIDICNRWNIELIEDAAESLGSYYHGKHTGTFGKIGVLSFNGNKTITTGGGGMLLFNDMQLAQKAKHLTTQAKVPHQWEFVHDQIGYNYRMPNINAALGCAQMEQIDYIIANKRKTAEAYRDFFQNSNIQFFQEPQNCRSNYWLNALVFENKEKQVKFLEETNSKGIMTRPIWRLMNRLPMFQDCQTDDLKNAMWLEDRVVNIPSSVINE